MNVVKCIHAFVTRQLLYFIVSTFFFFQDLLICYYLFELIVAINKLN